MSQFEYKQFYRRKLPHYQPAKAKLFITYRLAGSLPDHVLAKLRQEKELMEKALGKIENILKRKELQYEFQRRWFARYDAYLDQAEHGPKWLSDPRITRLVYDSIRYRDGKVYDLDCLSIMLNHVHQVIEPLPVGQIVNLPHSGQINNLSNSGQIDNLPYSISKIMHSLKRYTGTQANLILERTGQQFWQHENYDHVIRDDKEFERIIWYILNNPVKAGLVDSWEKWEWNYCKWM